MVATAKNKVACITCGYQIGVNKMRCPSCRSWQNRIILQSPNQSVDGTALLSEVDPNEVNRIVIGLPHLSEINTIFGGGITIGSVTLLGGMPGAGKSTLALQLSDAIASILDREILYVASEERSVDIRNRAKRLKLDRPDKVRIFPMGNHHDLGTCIMNRKPCAVMFDSLPGFVSSPDEAVELCKRMKEYAVSPDILAPFIVIDHVTKDDDFAGLNQLKHVVDTTITIKSSGNGEHREMGVLKNRFGKANIEIDLLMTAEGLRGLTQGELEAYMQFLENIQSEETEDDTENED